MNSIDIRNQVVRDLNEKINKLQNENIELHKYIDHLTALVIKAVDDWDLRHEDANDNLHNLRVFILKEKNE